MPGSCRITRSAAVLVCLAAAACSESTEPASQLTVDLTVVEVEGPTVRVAQEGSATIECSVTLRATAYGSGSASWTGGMLRYFVGAGGSVPVDSSEVTAAELVRGWGDSSIAAHETQVTRWTFTAGFPFTVQFEFAYRAAGRRETQTVARGFSCGSGTASGDLPPSIQDLEVSVDGGVLEPGGSITVGFEAAGPAGIWQSLVVVDGSCHVRQLFAEQLQPYVRRHTRLTIPTTCSPGGSVVVSVRVLDAGAREASRTASTAFPVVDVTPPTLTPLLWSPYTPGSATDLSGTFFDDDTLEIEMGAADNHRVAWLIWEVAPFGVRDSIPARVGSVEPRVRIPMEAGWRGDFQLTLSARDSMGLEHSVQSGAGALRVQPNLALTSRTDTIQWDIEEVEFDLARARLYVLQPFADQILILGFPSLQRLGTVKLNADPHGMDITPGGDSLLVTLGQQHRTLGIIDLTQTVLQVKEIPLAVDLNMLQSPMGLAAMANGKVFIALWGQTGPASNQLLEVDLVTGVQRIRVDASPQGSLGGFDVVRSRDGSRAAIDKGDAMRLYDAATDAFGPEVASGSFGHRITWSADGSRAAIGLDIYDGAFTHVQAAEPPLVGRAHSEALSPTGSTLYHSWNYLGIMVTRVSDGATLGRIRAMPVVEFLRVSPDGRHLLAAWGDGAQSSHLTVYDLP